MTMTSESLLERCRLMSTHDILKKKSPSWLGHVGLATMPLFLSTVLSVVVQADSGFAIAALFNLILPRLAPVLLGSGPELPYYWNRPRRRTGTHSVAPHVPTPSACIRLDPLVATHFVGQADN